MRAGRLHRRITLQRRSGALTTSGQPFDSWSDIATRWASVGPVRGTEGFSAPQVVATELVEIQIRYSAATADIHPGDRVIFPSASVAPTAVYNIIAVHEIGRREGQRVIAERLPIPDSGIPDPFDPTLFGAYIWIDPADIGSLYTDASHTDPVSGAGSAVGAIANTKGNLGGYATQATAGMRPTFETDSGLRWVETNGSQIITISATVAQPCYRVSALRRLVGNGTMLGHDGVGPQLDVFGDINLADYNGAASTFPGVAPAIGADFVIVERFDGSNSSIAIDGGATLPGNFGAGPFQGIGIGGVGPSQPQTGLRCYLTSVFPGALSASALAQIVTAAALKQGRVL